MTHPTHITRSVTKSKASYNEQTINFDFNESKQFNIYIRDESWAKDFKFENRIANYIYYPEVTNDGVFLSFTTAKKPTKKSLAWIVPLGYVILNKKAFIKLYKWIKYSLNCKDITQYFSQNYLDEIVNCFEDSRVIINKDIPIGCLCLWTTAGKEYKEACCDVVIVKGITPKEKDYQCLINTTRVYLVETVHINPLSKSFEEPPSALRLRKWVNTLDIEPLLSLEERNENNTYYRNGLVYFGLKYEKIHKKLQNYRNLDEICCKQIFDVLANGNKVLLQDKMVGKTKRFGIIIPLVSGKYCVKRYLRNKYSIQLNEWSRAGKISTLICNETRHALLYGPDATIKVISAADHNNVEIEVYTLCFQFSKLKISEINENTARIYTWSHVVRVLPGGLVIGKKEKRKRNKNKNAEHKQDAEDDEPVHDDQQLVFEFN